MRPKIPQLIKHINLPKRTKHTLHQSRLSDSLLDTIKAQSNLQSHADAAAWFDKVVFCTNVTFRDGGSSGGKLVVDFREHDARVLADHCPIVFP